MSECPGSSWSNPIWYGKWRIYLSHLIDLNYPYEFVHDDYDGAVDSKDNRNGYALSVDDAKYRIDHWDDEIMKEETAVTVWSYKAFNDDLKLYHRIVCFRPGSIVYNGNWINGSDSVWIVPGTLNEK